MVPRSKRICALHVFGFSRFFFFFLYDVQAVAKSKYEESVFPSNHTSVWGSFFDTRSMRWGFACCHSLTFKSYCTGEAGKVRGSVVSCRRLWWYQ